MEKIKNLSIEELSIKIKEITDEETRKKFEGIIIYQFIILIFVKKLLCIVYLLVCLYIYVGFTLVAF